MKNRVEKQGVRGVPRRDVVRACVASLVAATLLFVGQTAQAQAKGGGVQGGKVQVLVIYPGGPDAGGEGQKLLSQFIEMIAKSAGVAPETFAGAYFNEIEPALKSLRANRDAFVMGSLGIYMAHRTEFGLTPLAGARFAGSSDDRVYVLTKKGGPATLDALKGKTLSGNVLYEEPKFLSRVVFGGAVDVAKDFKLEPTQRPLSALRKVTSGTLDAVVINQMQYESLQRLPMFAELQVAFTSPILPSVGLMAVKSAATDKLREPMMKALLGMCESSDGANLCKNFGIVGFKACDEAALTAAVKQYEGK